MSSEFLQGLGWALVVSLVLIASAVVAGMGVAKLRERRYLKLLGDLRD